MLMTYLSDWQMSAMQAVNPFYKTTDANVPPATSSTVNRSAASRLAAIV